MRREAAPAAALLRGRGLRFSSARRLFSGTWAVAIVPALFPQLLGQPACTPLPWSAQPHLRQANLHGRTVGRHHGTAILGKQRQCPRMSRFLIEDFDGLAPRRGLGRADLTQIQNMALHHPAALEAQVLDDGPAGVRLAILPSPGLPQKHDPASLEHFHPDCAG